jgi:acyl-CoA reductase-like NAD-dependent aldehyde dehydrogenase
VPATFPTLVGGRLRRASATDPADAVAAARAALPGWSGTSPLERGRLLVDAAELLDERRDRLSADTPDEIGTAVDRWLWYAGWADKITDVVGSVRAADGSASWSTPRPLGVVGALAPGSLSGLVDVLAPVIATGSTAVVVTAVDRGLAEVLAVAAIPAGVVNLLTGDVAGLADELLRAGVDGLDLAGVPADQAAPLERAAAERGVRTQPSGAPTAGLARLRAWSAVTTVWHPVGR